VNRARLLLDDQLSAGRRPRRAHAGRIGTFPMPRRERRSHRPPADQPPPPPSVRWCLPVAALLTVLGALARWIGVADAPQPDQPEADLVAQVAAFIRSGAWPVDPVGGLPVGFRSLAVPQYAALSWLTGAWWAAPSELAAVREPAPLLWVLVAALVWVLARRIGLGPRSATTAVALLAVCPAAINAARVAAPENLAVLWLLLALVVAVGRPRPGAGVGRGRASMIALCLAVAVGTAPAALGAVPPALALYTRSRRNPRAARLAGVVAVIVVVELALLALPEAGTGSGVTAPAEWLAPGWLGRDAVTPVLALLATVFAMFAPTRRPLAVAVLASATLAMPFGGSVALVLPVATVLAVALARAALVPAVGRPRPLGPILLAGLVAVSWVPTLAGLPGASAAPPLASARQWLRDNLPEPDNVRAVRRLRVALVTAAAQPPRVSADAASCAPPVGSGQNPPACAPPTWWVRTPTSRPPGLPATATLIARFGGPGAPDRVEVLGDLPNRPDLTAERTARRVAGEALAASTRLRAERGVLARLRAGDVDGRATSALAALLSAHRVRLVDVPPVPGEVTPAQSADRPLRQLLLAPDGPAPVSGSADPERAIVDYFRAEQAPFRPDAVEPTEAGVLVRYSPLAPPDLLGAFLRH